MDKAAKLHCEAMQAIANGKVSLFNARRYKKALLNIPAGMDQSPASHQVLFLARENFNAIIEHRKKVFWSIANKIIIGVITGIILLAAKLFMDNYFNQNHPNYPKISQPQAQQGVRK